jgi:hypothetical protein
LCRPQGEGDGYWYEDEPQYHGADRYYEGAKDEEPQYYPEYR